LHALQRVAEEFVNALRVGALGLAGPGQFGGVLQARGLERTALHFAGRELFRGRAVQRDDTLQLGLETLHGLSQSAFSCLCVGEVALESSGRLASTRFTLSELPLQHSRKASERLRRSRRNAFTRRGIGHRNAGLIDTALAIGKRHELSTLGRLEPAIKILAFGAQSLKLDIACDMFARETCVSRARSLGVRRETMLESEQLPRRRQMPQEIDATEPRGRIRVHG
jgi:hypothetical protein